MFPLYNQLTNKIQNIELNEDQKQYFIEQFKILTKNEHELIFALIRMHQMNTKDSTFYTLPYGAKNQKSGIKFDFEKLPNELQWILYEFIHLHVES